MIQRLVELGRECRHLCLEGRDAGSEIVDRLEFLFVRRGGLLGIGKGEASFLEVGLELGLLLGRGRRNLLDQAGTLGRQFLQLVLLLLKLGCVIPQGTLFAGEPRHLVAQALTFGSNALGATGSQVLEAGGIEGVGRVKVGKDDGFNLGDQFSPDVVVGTEALDEPLGEATDTAGVRLLLANASIRHSAVAPSQPYAEILQVVASPLQKHVRLGGGPAAGSVGDEFGERGFAGAFPSDYGYEVGIEGDFKVVEPAVRGGQCHRADHSRLVVPNRRCRADVDPIGRLVKDLLEALEGRICLDPTVPVVVRAKEVPYVVCIGAVDTWSEAAETLDRNGVVRVASSEPEVALAGAARKDHLAKARDLLAVASPGSALLKT